jgi:hypothetical protein
VSSKDYNIYLSTIQMMVQRLLILLVNKNNNMKCAIALDINEGKYPATVEQFGAKTIASNSTIVHPRDLSVKTFYRR